MRSARSDFISLWFVCTLVTADLRNKVDVTCPCIPPFLHAALIAVETWPDVNLPPLQDKNTWDLLLSYSSLEDSTTWRRSSFMYNPIYENKENDNTTRAGPWVSAVLCSLTLMTMLSSTFFAFLYSSIVIFAKTPERCAFAMVISRRIKSLTIVYTDWLTCKECAPLRSSRCAIALRAALLRSYSLICSGVTRLLRSLLIFSRCLRLLSFLYDMDQRRAFSWIWRTSAGSTSTLAGFSAIT